MLKYWDLDRFEMLLELPGHHSEVWALAVSAYGDFCMTGTLGWVQRVTLKPFVGVKNCVDYVL